MHNIVLTISFPKLVSKAMKAIWTGMLHSELKQLQGPSMHILSSQVIVLKYQWSGFRMEVRDLQMPSSMVYLMVLLG